MRETLQVLLQLRSEGRLGRCVDAAALERMREREALLKAAREAKRV